MTDGPRSSLPPAPQPGDAPLIVAIDSLLGIETPAMRALREGTWPGGTWPDGPAQLPPGGAKPGSAMVRTSRR